MAKKILDVKDLSVWESNMKTLRSLQPELANRLDAWVGEHGHAFEHEETTSNEGTWVSGLTERPFFQAAEPPSLPWRKNERISVLFVHGVGTPPWLFERLRSVPKDLLALIVIEPDIGLLAYTLHLTHVYMAIPPICRLSFATSAKERDVEETLRSNLSQMGTYAAADAKAIKHLGETETFREQFAKLWAAIRERIVLKLTELGNSAEDTLLGLRQIALVSPWFAFGSSLSMLSEKFKGRPFIWVASGPSLDKNFTLLKENNDRAVIICADSALKKLLGEGIVPHAVVALERGLHVRRMLAESIDLYPDLVKDVLLVIQAVCVVEAVAKWPGPKVVVGKLEIPVDQWLIGQIVGGDLLLSGLSVAHMGMQMANALGASSLAIIGQDLAFGENLNSHATSTIWESVREEEKRLAGETPLMITAALGGEVRTTQIWLSFLRIIERYMVNFSFPMFDCTEGGALINGTIIKPFREWIDEELSKFEPVEETPSEILRGKKLDSDAIKESVERVLERGKRGFEFIKGSQKRLDDIEEEMRKVCAPAILPEVRQKLAYKMSENFDRLHASNPVIEFIGQSITTLNAAGVARTRFLDSVEMVEEWKVIHSEIVSAHRKTLEFMESWLKYMCTALTVYAKEDNDISIDTLPFYKEEDVEDISKFSDDIKAERAIEFLKELMNAQNEDERVRAHAVLDNLIARADTKWWRFWDSRIDWKVALALEMEGRALEAIPFMQRTEELEMGVNGMSPDEAAVFLRDMARILASHDLCHFPDYDKARLYAQNSAELSSGDEDAARAAQATMEFINKEAAEHLSTVEASIIGAGNRASDRAWLNFERTRLEAEEALVGGDVMKTLEVVWKLVREHHTQMPQKVFLFWQWLETHFVRFDEAGQNMDEGVFKEIFDEILPRLSSITNMGIPISNDFMEFMKRRGIKFEMEQ